MEILHNAFKGGVSHVCSFKEFGVVEDKQALTA